MTVGERLRALRRARGLTLAQVAGDDVSVPLVSKIERDLVTPSLLTLRALARRLGVHPGTLLGETEIERSGDRDALGSLDRARARMLLGDPAAAAREAAAAMESATDEALRARLLALRAEASLGAGDVAQAGVYVWEGSQVAPAGRAQAELAWVLGSLERRRGARGAAQRAWAAALDGLASAHAAGDPTATLTVARIQSELAGLHEQGGERETARHFLDRAEATLRPLADALALARALLPNAPAAPMGMEAGDVGVASASLALAVLAAAQRLQEQVQRDRERLLRTAARVTAAAAPAEVPHSRHLR